MAEALALHKGIQEAIKLNIKDIYIEGDNLLVINSLKGIWTPPWKLQNIIQDSRTLLQHFHSTHIKHIFREANRAADWIANVGHLIVEPLCIPPNSSPNLDNIVQSDSLGFTLVRRGT
ncbi:uncharacterized protein [Spinacia oleracea]|uniref:RNase H type-1 domain-containing protein n=1 Tax=Spinacia oleracea TaxID=3562 RepID=A0ABM3R479_SPIOL|nr:uncharacterized protein LOC130465615 [Spinacia oleracea]